MVEGGDSTDDRNFEDLLHDLEDSIFATDDSGSNAHQEEHVTGEKKERRRTLPTLVDEKTAQDILKDVMKERNQRKYDVMGVEVMFRPYWFFTYTCELIMKDENGNTVDSEEIGGRVAIDAVNGSLSDYLQDLLDNEPIEAVDLVDEIAQVGGEPKVVEPKISEKRLEGFVKQKISGTLRADKDNVSVAGFEVMWSPVYKFWLTIKKKTHNVQIDGCGGYPVNYDEVPLKPKTWFDRILDDIGMLKNPSKWREFIKKKSRGASAGAAKRPSTNTIEIIAGIAGLVLFLVGLSSRDPVLALVGVAMVGALFWYVNQKRKKVPRPLPYPIPPGAPGTVPQEYRK